MFYIIGLGNPGEEYRNSRHNAGRMAVEFFAHRSVASDAALINKQKKIKIILPDTFMNHSGRAVAQLIKSPKSAKNLIVAHDDIDLPLGTMKISYNKNSGGHRGLESVIKAVKTKEFVRIRIGISPAARSGKVSKPKGEKKVLDFILGEFTPKESKTIKKVFEKSSEAINTIIAEGREKAMSRFN